MDNVIEVVALLRKHSELELQIRNGRGAAVATEQELEATVRRLAAHPHARSAPFCRRRELAQQMAAHESPRRTALCRPRGSTNLQSLLFHLSKLRGG
jgi:hypothetical protein